MVVMIIMVVVAVAVLFNHDGGARSGIGVDGENTRGVAVMPVLMMAGLAVVMVRSGDRSDNRSGDRSSDDNSRYCWWYIIAGFFPRVWMVSRCCFVFQ